MLNVFLNFSNSLLLVPQGFRFVEPTVALVAARLAPHYAKVIQNPTKEDRTGYEAYQGANRAAQSQT